MNHAKPTAAAPAADTALYRHATGLTFAHPADWRVQATVGGGLSLTPADQRMVDGQAGEVFTLVGEPAGGIASAANPQVAPYVTGMVTRCFPHLRQQGEVRTFAVAGRDCVELMFAGNYADTDFRAAAQVTVLADTVLVALTLTTSERFADRRAAMGALFGSLRMATGAEAEGENVTRDPALVGRWQHQEIYHSDVFTGTLVRNLQLAADGSCQESTAGTGSLDGLGSVGSSGGDVAQGRWRTDGRQLIMNWADGSTTLVRYHLQGRSMLWSAGGTTKLWQR